MPGDVPQLVSTTVAKNTFVYDMILLSNDVKEEFPPGLTEAKYAEDFGIIHFDESGGVGHQAGAEAMTHNTLKNAYSDHRPLWMRFQINAGQGDAISGGVDLTPPTAPAQYVATKSGKRFHRPNCSTIRRRATPRKWASRSEAATKLTPCRVCKP